MPPHLYMNKGRERERERERELRVYEASRPHGVNKNAMALLSQSRDR